MRVRVCACITYVVHVITRFYTLINYTINILDNYYNNCYSSYSTLTSISLFHNLLTLLLNKHAPLTTKLLPTHQTTPLFSTEHGLQK